MYSAGFQRKGLDFRATQEGAYSDKSLRLGHLKGHPCAEITTYFRTVFLEPEGLEVGQLRG